MRFCPKDYVITVAVNVLVTKTKLMIMKNIVAAKYAKYAIVNTPIITSKQYSTR